MIKFFRKIRQQMLTENKSSKYLLYAIGEIFLVVIGILIALQINNWNENEKTAAFELELLHSFKDGLEHDLEDIKANVWAHKRSIAAIDTLLYLLESDEPYNSNKVSRHFSDAMTVTYFQYSTSAFETLKSKVITTIAKKELRDQIIGVYDSQFNFFLTFHNFHVVEVERGLTEIFSSRFK